MSETFFYVSAFVYAHRGLWGAPRVHGELPKLGIEVAQSTVANHMAIP